jgi:hypothetical protein
MMMMMMKMMMMMMMMMMILNIRTVKTPAYDADIEYSHCKNSCLGL